MLVKVHMFALVASIAAALCVVAVSAGQRNNKVVSNPPASPQAKTSQPATHFTQGTITSIDANQVVIAKKVRGKAEQVTFAINSQTQRLGNLVTGSRVSVQYREADHQFAAAAVRELPSEVAVKPGKAYKPRPKS